MPSFDVVSVVNMQEVRNAVDQVHREITTRYDFKGSKSALELKDKENLIIILADDKMKLSSIQELMRQKLAKRGVSLKSSEWKEVQSAGGDMLRQELVVKQGLALEESKRITKAVKEMKAKVSAAIQADQVRITGKKKDDLQAVIGQLRAMFKDLELQFVNFRE